ncbi:MAG: ABC transporter ATP-binding protein [Eubacteriales bacterium]|nr:ABC transporter ATP-binding protein [Eubacteriales bacterium]
MLRLENLNFRYENGARILYDVNLEFPDNGMIGITGPSGSGKSTLLYTIAGFKRQYWSGSVVFNKYNYQILRDDDILKMRKKEFALIFQKPFLIPYLTILDNVLTSLNSYEQKDTALALMEELGIREYALKKPYALSGGQQQRAAIARALINSDAKLILADEPTASLDLKSAICVMDMLKKLSNDLLIFVVTHDTRLAHYFDRTLILTDGQIQQSLGEE